MIRGQHTKVNLLGDSGVGKSALLSRFTKNQFSENFIPTVGLDYAIHSLEHNGIKLWLQIWDGAGEERYRELVGPFLKGSHAVILVFDLTNARSFQNISTWLDDIRGKAEENAKIILVGNKCDLEANREVTREEAQKLADSLNIIYIEASAKVSMNVEKIFNDLIAQIPSDKFETIPDNRDVQDSSIEKTDTNEVNSSDDSTFSTGKIKVTLLGDSGVGKTCLLTRLTKNVFEANCSPTIGVDFTSYRLHYNATEKRLQIWDVSGHERFRSLIYAYLRNAGAILLIFDLTKRESFESIRRWFEMINTGVGENVKIVLVGNKCDLMTERVISRDSAENLAKSLKIQYIETSVKDSNNVQEAFQLLVGFSGTVSSQKQASPLLTSPKTESIPAPITYDSGIRILKILLVGDASVGKSSLLTRFADDMFHDEYLPTIGVDFKIRVFEYERASVKLQIWDTAGQERFRSITASYYRGANGVLIVFDVTNHDSFKNIQTWITEVDRYSSSDVKKVLVGNKCDLTANRVISRETVQKVADNLSIPYVEASAKTSDNVEESFRRIAREIVPNPSTTDVSRAEITAGYQSRPEAKSSSIC